MKRSHLLTIIILVALMAYGWFGAITGSGDPNRISFSSYMESAKEHLQRGLYWKSGQEYLQALKFDGKEADWATMLDAFRTSYEQGDDCFNEYLAAAESAVNAYQNNEDFVLQLASLYVQDENYGKALRTLSNAIDAGADSEQIQNQLIDVQYSFDYFWAAFDEVRPCIHGMFLVRQHEEWYYTAADGTVQRYKNADNLGPMGEDGIYPICINGSLILCNTDGVPQGIIHADVQQIGVYAQGLIPIQSNGTWSYYDLIGDLKFGGFDEAGSFVDGMAAVKSGSEWWLIDTEGNRVDDSTFEQIVLGKDGSWMYNNVMIAKKEGTYRLFDEDCKQIGSFSCDAMDSVMDDGPIAFCSGGKWGYIDHEGNVLAEPVYQEARSFSNGLAAVRNGTLWGFVDESMELVIGHQFLDVGYFTEKGSCTVKDSEHWKMIMCNVWD